MARNDASALQLEDGRILLAPRLRALLALAEGEPTDAFPAGGGLHNSRAPSLRPSYGCTCRRAPVAGQRRGV